MQLQNSIDMIVTNSFNQNIKENIYTYIMESCYLRSFEPLLKQIYY